MSLELLQLIYDDSKSLPTSRDFYLKSLLEIEMFNIASQIYYLLKVSKKLEQTPIFFQEALKQKFEETVYLNLFIKNQTELIMAGFEKNHIDVIPLKGTGFAEKFFGHIGARPTSDIDLLIKLNDIERAKKCLESLNFIEDVEQCPNHFHFSFSKEIPGSPIPLSVEIHWDLLKKKTANFDIKEFWDCATKVNSYKHVKELSDSHTMYMICLHGWRHNLDSLKYFIDIVQMVHYLGDKLDFSALLRDTRSHKTFKRIVRTFSIVYQQFPHLNKISVFPCIKSILFWDFNAIKPGSRKTFKNYLDFIDYQFLSYDTFKHSLRVLRYWFCPSRAELSLELGTKDHKKANYLSLYKKRVVNVLKIIFFIH